ncbi:conserved hypothetical protein [Cupriavidus taiwanensis]|uniref:hypothetical protein n=1 Tax=Cupriavidus taiwanensis TaxID=164546 RepID=UPI000E1AFAFA|nr:hypothetical protein [Cupriavidus taiwanensis]SOZ97448.1 conserved hypothetical protein [Cupriavidus taiwanensis]
MQKNSERTVLHFDVKLEASASAGQHGTYRGLTPLPLVDVLRHVERLFAKGNLLARESRSRAELCYLADIRVNKAPGYAELLINRSDKNAPDLVLSEPKLKSRRLINKVNEEGSDFSAHIVFKLAEVAPNTYRVGLEQSPGLPSSKVERFLNLLLRVCSREYRSEMLRPHPTQPFDKDGKPRVVGLKHKFIFKGHPSKYLLSDLESGTLDSLELIDQKQKARHWDSNGYIVEESRIIRLKQAPKGIKGKVIDAIEAVCAQGKRSKLELLRVRFTSSDGLPRKLEFDTYDAEVVNDEQYIQKEIISNFPNPLPSSFATLEPEVMKRMRSLVK